MQSSHAVIFRLTHVYLKFWEAVIYTSGDPIILINFNLRHKTNTMILHLHLFLFYYCLPFLGYLLFIFGQRF